MRKAAGLASRKSVEDFELLDSAKRGVEVEYRWEKARVVATPNTMGALLA